MNILYLVNMKEGHAGGLFKATYERIRRHNKHASSFIENINYYDSKLITFIKERVFKKAALKFTKQEYAYDGLKIHNLNFVRGLSYYFNKIFNLEKNNLEAMLAAFIEKNEKAIAAADLIHAHWGYPNGYLAYRISQQYHIPYFITFHGSDLNNIRDKEAGYLLEAMEQAEKCFFVSKQLLENAIALGYSGSNAEVTYNGVDLERFKIPDKSLQENKIVGYVGSLEPAKGADRLPALFEGIAQESEATPDFIVVGAGSLKEEIEQTFEEKALAVQMPGQLPFAKVPKILKGFDVLVVPSKNEGLGMVILEANAMGIPAVGTNVGGIPEAIGYRENLIEPNDALVDNMAQRVATILDNDREDPNKYRKRVCQQFLWEDIVAIEREHYLNALEK